MNDIKNFVEDLGIVAFEANIKIAGIAVMSDLGRIVFQTTNWDLIDQTKAILDLIKGLNSIVLSGQTFQVIERNSNGIIAKSESGMGSLIFAPFQGGSLISYAMPQTDLVKALDFLKNYAVKLKGKV